MPDVIDYNYHIRPILSDRCFKCHGPDANKRKAGLRLDTPEGAYAAFKDNPSMHAIVPGHPESSDAFQRLITNDTSLRMPTMSSHLTVTPHEIDLIEKWIKQGAVYKPHWAFIKPAKSELPDADEDWVRNPIDYFVYAKMAEKSLKPSPEASKEQLLKRVCLDLTGLPPTLEMQDRFLQDDSPQAYEKIVTELISSKHYGEKMSIQWLDLARYADSHGYQDDGLRTMWPWRDWVIHAFNSNYSYAKFVTWQLAGDRPIAATIKRDAARYWLQPQSQDYARRRGDRRGIPRGICERPDEYFFEIFPCVDLRVCALPRSQIRSYFAERLLQHLCLLQSGA